MKDGARHAHELHAARAGVDVCGIRLFAQRRAEREDTGASRLDPVERCLPTIGQYVVNAKLPRDDEVGAVGGVARA